MVVDVDIKLSVYFTAYEEEGLKDLAKNSGMTVEEVVASSLKRILMKKAAVPESGIKLLEVNVTE